MKILYNTSTGNSLYVAKKIASSFKESELLSIPKMIKQKKYEIEDDMIGIIFPIHWAGVPIVVYNYLAQLKINKDTYVFAIGVSGGGGADTAFYIVNKLLERKIENYLTIKYISNYTRVGRNPDKIRIEKAIKRYDSKIDDFIEKLKQKESVKCDFRKGFGNIEYYIFKEMIKNKDKRFNTNEKCTGCELCSKICPVSNIEIRDNKPVWKGKCADCMACINICPKEAINIGKSTIKKNRYRNPYITAQEIIDNE